jgi:probable F420-dependent oxidoreductase
MKFSVCLATGYEGLAYPIPFCEPQDLIRDGRLCEELGYDGVWGNDHITTQHYVREAHAQPPSFYDVLITMAMIAQATTRLRVGTALLVMPMRDPVQLAKQVFTIDRLSGGRFILGVGIGAYREEFEAWAGSRYPHGRRGEMLDEGLAAFNLLLTERSASLEGKYYSFKGIEMFPKPGRQPFPLYIGGHNIAAVERAARLGCGWLPGWRPFHEIAERILLLRRLAGECGRDPHEIEVAPQFSLHIGKTKEAAIASYMQTEMVAHRKSLAHTGRDPEHQVTGNLVGSPASILEQLGILRGMGVDHCSAMAIAVNSHEQLIEQIRWFAEEIMPHMR